MATEDQLRDVQIQYLADDMALRKAQAWTPSIVDVARLVIARMDDKYSGTAKPNVQTCVDEVVEVLKTVQAKTNAPDFWVPAAKQ